MSLGRTTVRIQPLGGFTRRAHSYHGATSGCCLWRVVAWVGMVARRLKDPAATTDVADRARWRWHVAAPWMVHRLDRDRDCYEREWLTPPSANRLRRKMGRSRRAGCAAVAVVGGRARPAAVIQLQGCATLAKQPGQVARGNRRCLRGCTASRRSRSSTRRAAGHRRSPCRSPWPPHQRPGPG